MYFCGEDIQPNIVVLAARASLESIPMLPGFRDLGRKAHRATCFAPRLKWKAIPELRSSVGFTEGVCVMSSLATCCGASWRIAFWIECHQKRGKCLMGKLILL